MIAMCIKGLMSSDTSNDGMDNKTIFATGYSDAPGSIKMIGGRQVAPSDSRINGRAIF